MAEPEGQGVIDTSTPDSGVELINENISEIAGEEDAFTPEELEAIKAGELDGDQPIAEPQPRAEEEPAEKPAEPAEKPAGEEKEPDGRTVPLEALHEARAELKALREEQEKMQQWRDGLVNRIQEARQQQEALRLQAERAEQARQQEAAPDENEDPLAAIAWLKQQLLKEREELDQFRNQTQEQRQQQEQATRQQQQVSEMLREADAVIGELSEKNPVVGEAVEFAGKAIRQELAQSNPGMTSPQLDAAVEQAMINYVYNAPTDPAMLETYIMRNARYWGFEPKPQEQPQAQPQDQLRRMERASAASKTLSGSGDGATDLSVANIEAMSEEELLALPDDVLDRLIKDT